MFHGLLLFSGFGDEALEDCAGDGADVLRALGVPLEAEDEVGLIPCLLAFNGFDDTILRGLGGDGEAIAYGL